MPKPRWKFSFVNRSPSSPPPPSPPASFLCPISSSLMFDPVILPTGHTFERSCIEACIQLNLNPPPLLSSPLRSSSSSSSSPSSSSPLLLIPNAALKSAIIDWCDRFGVPHPSSLSQESAVDLVHCLMAASPSKSQQRPNAAAAAEQYSHNNNGNNSSSSSNNQKQSPPPSSISSSSYPSSSSISSFSSPASSETINITSCSPLKDDADDDCKNPKSATAAPTTGNDALEEEIFSKLKNPQIFVKESALVTLRHSTRDSADLRLSLCTPRILAAVVPMISLSKNACVQINATASVVNLSLEPANKVKIVRSGAVPPLVEALRSPHCSGEARGNAAGALFSLALEDENKLPIGVLGAIPPLVDLFCQQEHEGWVARVEAGMALYHLSSAPNNVSKIVKTAGAVKALLTVATIDANAKGEHVEMTKLHRVAMMVLASLAGRNEGRVALMDAGAVKAMVEGLTASKGGEEEEYCLAVMHEMSIGADSTMRFRALARAAGAERALLADKDTEGKGEMATRMLRVIRGDYEEEGTALVLASGREAEEEGSCSVVSEGLVTRYADDFAGISSSNSDNFELAA